jgi:hypothetical protein
MSSAKLVAAMLAAVLLTGCGSIAVTPAGGRGQVDNPTTMNPNHLQCLRQALHLPVNPVNGQTLQIGSLPAGPTVVFMPNPSSAQDAEIAGRAQGAEAIGSALLWVHQGSDSELRTIEDCLAVGVKG